MLAIRVELLTGRYAATRFNDRKPTEWPPHPARLFSALVAAWADAETPDPHERDVLTWLEALVNPVIAASDAAPRRAGIFFVPNNEAASVVVADQAASYEKLTDLDAQLRVAHESLALDPGKASSRKEADRLIKLIAKLHEKVMVDSRRSAAAKPAESAGAVRDGVQLLPEERGKQGRTFPVVIPHDPVVHFIWSEVDPSPDQRATLDALLGRISRLGHSSSMVACSVVDEAPAPTLVPSREGAEQLRVMAPGLLDELEHAFAAHQGNEPRSLPVVLAGYRRPFEVPVKRPRSCFDDRWIVLADISEGNLPLVRTLELSVAVRGALIRHANDPTPEIISGHHPGDAGELTGPSERTHLAIVPLAFVGHEHADGNIRGVGLVLPRDATDEERADVVEAVENWIDASGGVRAVVTLGRSGIRSLERTDLLTASATLKPDMWCRPSAYWVSVTPVALDRFANRLWSTDRRRHAAAEQAAIETIRRACEHAGLPRPPGVEVTPSSPLSGVPPLRGFRAYESPGRHVRRQCVHVRLGFDEPVQGPVLIGAGRYFGYGLLRPVGREGSVAAPPQSTETEGEVA